MKLNFSQEQIDRFQKWKKEFHDEITRLKKEEEQKGYSNTLSGFYKLLCKLEKHIDAVEITIPSEVSTTLGSCYSIFDTEVKFGGIMERYIKNMSCILYRNVEVFYIHRLEEVQYYAIEKKIELRNIFDLFE